MNKLKQITASRELCEQIVQLGISPAALFYHVKELEDIEADKPSWIWVVSDEPRPEDEETPAWTKAELDVMIGPDILKPDLPARAQLSELQKPELFIFYFARFSRQYARGADASADVLKEGLKSGDIKPEEAMERYNKHFTA